MTKRSKEPEIVNPRYAGATPEMVGRALLRREPDEAADDGASPTVADPAIQSSI